MNKVLLACAVASVVLSACASSAAVTVNTMPSGAYITELGTGKSYGISPTKIQYDATTLQNSRNVNGCFQVQGVEARWVSGARSTSDSVILLCNGFGEYNISVQRNLSDPELGQDMQFSLQLDSAAAQRQIAADVRAQAAIQILNGIVPDPPARTATTCTSQKIGTTVQTDCR